MGILCARNHVSPHQPMSRITGDKLLALFEDLNSKARSMSEIVEAAGYVDEMPDGKKQRRFAQLKKALLAAKGLDLGARKKNGRPLGHSTSVLTKGHAVIGAGYLRQIGLERGDRIDIAISKGRIVLTKAEAS